MAESTQTTTSCSKYTQKQKDKPEFVSGCIKMRRKRKKNELWMIITLTWVTVLNDQPFKMHKIWWQSHLVGHGLTAAVAPIIPLKACWACNWVNWIDMMGFDVIDDMVSNTQKYAHCTVLTMMTHVMHLSLWKMHTTMNLDGFFFGGMKIANCLLEISKNFIEIHLNCVAVVDNYSFYCIQIEKKKRNEMLVHWLLILTMTSFNLIILKLISFKWMKVYTYIRN